MKKEKKWKESEMRKENDKIVKRKSSNAQILI